MRIQVQHISLAKQCCYCHGELNDGETWYCGHFSRASHVECMIDMGSDCEPCQENAADQGGLVNARPEFVHPDSRPCVSCGKPTIMVCNDCPGWNDPERAVYVCRGKIDHSCFYRHVNAKIKQRERIEQARRANIVATGGLDGLVYMGLAFLVFIVLIVIVSLGAK